MSFFRRRTNSAHKKSKTPSPTVHTGINAYISREMHTRVEGTVYVCVCLCISVCGGTHPSHGLRWLRANQFYVCTMQQETGGNARPQGSPLPTAMKLSFDEVFSLGLHPVHDGCTHALHTLCTRTFAACCMQTCRRRHVHTLIQVMLRCKCKALFDTF